ncbi:MAG TPA: PilN domain-containing protein [Solirubrobacterales bacterium]
MRPVNLIPPEERSGERRPMRGGPLAYVIVGALAAAVIGAAVLAITSNQIADSKAEISQVEAEKISVESQAAELESFTSFHSLHEQRLATITSLADSRFDWERVMRELALVLPGNVWLTNLTGTASPSVSVEGAGSVSLRTSVLGPALEFTGCARSQNAVAGFVQALKEIDGVTRVGVQTSAIGESSGSSSNCQTRNFIAQFQMVAAFDAAPVTESESGGAPEAAPEEATEGESTPTSETEGT